MKTPNKFIANEQFAYSLLHNQALIDQYWVPSRPLGGISSRFRLAWDVFWGKADVLYWMNNQ